MDNAPISVTVAFASEAAANYPVAGVPAAARAAAAIARAGAAHCTIAVAGGWTPSNWCRAEWERLAGDMAIVSADLAQVTSNDVSRGENLVSGDFRHVQYRANDESEAIAELRRAGGEILRATGKPADGIVSRYFNRPISRAISAQALRIPGVTPFHATLGTAAFGLAMAGALFLGGHAGLLAGAVLFQAASIFDGVDGEIARATWRSSASGAKLDSLVDAATNLAFILGVAFNLWQQGDPTAGLVGLCVFVVMGTGLFLVGQMAKRKGGDFTFDAMKSKLGQARSRTMRMLTYIAMRDFYAAGSAVLVLLGFGREMLITFLLVALVWLALVCFSGLADHRHARKAL